MNLSADISTEQAAKIYIYDRWSVDIRVGENRSGGMTRRGIESCVKGVV
jgi:hypothetical protein